MEKELFVSFICVNTMKCKTKLQTEMEKYCTKTTLKYTYKGYE